MRFLIVLSCEGTPEDVPSVLSHIDPPGVPCFAGMVRVVPEPYADQLIEWLD